MKRLKRIASIVLAMVMVLGMSLTAFATGATPPTDETKDPSNTLAENGEFTLTIDDQTTGYTYAVYQIFRGDLSKDGERKTMSNIQWGASIDQSKIASVFPKKDKDGNVVEDEDGNVVPMTAADVAASIAVSAEDSDATNEFDSDIAKKFAADIAKCLNGTTTTVEEKDVFTPTAYKEVSTVTANRGYVFDKLPVGYYMVANTNVPTEDGEYTRYMMEIVGDLTAKPKRGTLEDDKYIKVNNTTPEGIEGVDYFKVNEAPIGGTVEYNIPVKLPENFADYKSYYLEFYDILSKGLTLTSTTQDNSTVYDIKVKVVNGSILNGKTVTKKEDVKAVMDVVEGEGSVSEGTTIADVTANFKKKVTGVESDDTLKKGGTLIQVWMHDLRDLNPENGEVVVKAGSWVILTYSAKLNTDALIGTGNPNYVSIKYSNNPNNSDMGTPDNPDEPNPKNPTGETPEKRVDTYTTELTITKTDEAGTVLPGVEFKLSGAGVNIILVTEEIFDKSDEGEYWKLKDGSYTKEGPIIGGEDDNSRYYESTKDKYKKTTKVIPKGNVGNEVTEVKGTVNEDGTVTFKGLGAGSYTLEETYALPGYNRIDPITFEVIWTGREFITDNDAIEMGAKSNLVTTIVNHKGSLLPSTGGIGTTIFYVVGGILVLGAGVLLVAKKRMSNR